MSEDTRRMIGVGIGLLIMGLLIGAAEEIRAQRFGRWLEAKMAQPAPVDAPPAEA